MWTSSDGLNRIMQKLSLIYALKGRQCDHELQHSLMKRLDWASKRDLGTYSELPSTQRVIKVCTAIRCVGLQADARKYQPQHHMSLNVRNPECCLQTTKAQTSLHIRAVWPAPLSFTIWKAKQLGQISLISYFGVGSNVTKSLATPLVIIFVQWQNLIFNYIQIVCQNFCVHIYRWCVQRYQWRIYKCHSMHQIQLNEFYYSMYLTCLKTVLWIICSLSDNIISYHHKFRLLYQHITNLQLTHKRENENELNKEEAYSSTSFSR